VECVGRENGGNCRAEKVLTKRTGGRLHGRKRGAGKEVLKSSLGIKLKKRGESAGSSKTASKRPPRRFRERIIV